MNKQLFKPSNKQPQKAAKAPTKNQKLQPTIHKLDPRLPDFIKLHPIFSHYPIEKRFSLIGLDDFTKKLPGTSLSVIFSTTPFDIATMSMRGTTSCMRWGNPNSSSLVGSIIDPYCGLIYLTDDKQVFLNENRDGYVFKKGTPKASKIISRCVVRLVKQIPIVSKPMVVALERLYGTDYIGAPQRNISTTFQLALNERATSPSFLLTRDNAAKYVLLQSDPVDELLYYDVKNWTDENKGWISYRDSQIGYWSGKIDDAIRERKFSFPADDEDEYE